MSHLATGIECRYSGEGVKITLLTKTARGTTVRFAALQVPSGQKDKSGQLSGLADALKPALPRRDCF